MRRTITDLAWGVLSIDGDSDEGWYRYETTQDTSGRGTSALTWGTSRKHNSKQEDVTMEQTISSQSDSSTRIFFEMGSFKSDSVSNMSRPKPVRRQQKSEPWLSTSFRGRRKGRSKVWTKEKKSTILESRAISARVARGRWSQEK